MNQGSSREAPNHRTGVQPAGPAGRCVARTMSTVDALDEIVAEGVRRRMAHLTAEDDTFNGRT